MHLRLEMLEGERREHLDGNSGVVEASPVHIAPISAGLQPQPLGEVVGGQPDLLRRVLAEGAARVGESGGHSNCVLLLAELDPSVKHVSLAPELLDLPHHLRSLPYRPLELRLRPRLGQHPYLKLVGELRLHLRQRNEPPPPLFHLHPHLLRLLPLRFPFLL